MKPSVLVDRLHLLRQSVVSVHQTGALDDDLTDLAGSGKAGSFIPDPDFMVRKAASHRDSSLLQRICTALNRDDRRALCLAVSDQELAAAKKFLKTHHLDRSRESAANDAHSKLAGQLLFKFRHGCKHAVDRAYRTHIRDVMFNDHAHQGIRLQERRNMQMPSHRQVAVSNHQPVAVEHRKSQTDRLADVIFQDLHRAFCIVQNRIRRLQNSLRNGSRSRSIDDYLRVLRLCARQGLFKDCFLILI